MTEHYILDSYHHLLGGPEPNPRQWVYKSRHVYDSLFDACKVMFFYDQRMFFQDVAWDHGFFSHIVNQELISPKKGLLFEQFAIDKYATPELPAGLYLYTNLKIGSLKRMETQIGYDLSRFEKKGPNGEMLLLATKAEISAPIPVKQFFNYRKVLNRSNVVLPSTNRGISNKK